MADRVDLPSGDFDPAELGAIMRELRTAIPRELTEVAAELRIRQNYLEAIEAGRLDELPGPAYATGFLRAYGDYLGLNGADIVSRFKAAGVVADQQTALHLPSPVEEGRLPTGSVLLLAAILAMVAYGGWYYLSSDGGDPVDVISDVPDQIASVGGIDVDGTAATADEGETNGETQGDAPDQADTATQTAVLPEGEAPNGGPAGAEAQSEMTRAATKPPPPTPQPKPLHALRSGSDGAESSPPATVSGPPPIRRGGRAGSAEPMTADVARAPSSGNGGPRAVPNVPPPERTTALPLPPRPPPATRAAPTNGTRPASTSEPSAAPSGGQVAVTRGNEGGTPMPTASRQRIVLRANADSWVEVRKGDASPVYSGLMRSGETFEVPNEDGFRLATGNAGAIEILINGEAAPPLGPVGTVRRDVALDPATLLGASGPTR